MEITKIKKMSKILRENLTLTQLTKFLNEESCFVKKNGINFTTNDVWQYIKLEHLPHYMGGNKISKSNKIEGLKLYNIYENE